MISLQQLASPSFHRLFSPFLRIFQLNTSVFAFKIRKTVEKIRQKSDNGVIAVKSIQIQKAGES